MDTRFSVHDRSWVDVLAGRCQTLVGQVPDVARMELAAQLRQLVSDIPAQLQVRERIVTHAIVSNVLGKTACMTGIAHQPEVARAFVVWAAADSTSDSLSADASRIAASCAVALEAHSASDLGKCVVDPRVKRALLLVQRRYSDPGLTLKELAEESGVSVWHAARLLKEETGSGFSAHVHRYRIDASCRMLSDTTLSVKEISVAVGYGSSSQFGRHFRRLMGTTPHSYRADIRA